MARSPVVAAILRLNGRAFGRSDECAVASSVLQLAGSVARSSIRRLLLRARAVADEGSKTGTWRHLEQYRTVRS